jgi:hypothetical protein
MGFGAFWGAMAGRSLKPLSKNRFDGWSYRWLYRFVMSQFLDETSVCQSFLRSRAALQRGRNQKNPGNRGKGTGLNVSNGSSKNARKNTASVSAEPTRNSAINSLS